MRKSAVLTFMALAWTTACGDDDAAATASDGTTTITTTAGPTTLTTAGTMGGTGGSAGTTSTGTGTATGTGGDFCMTELCGNPAVCCAAGDECVQGACAPPCPSGVRCGADQLTCCPDGDVCLSDSCVTPGQVCGDSFDCPSGEFCEPTLGQCLPQSMPVACEVQPTFTSIDVTLEWFWNANQVLGTPVVADITGNGVSEVVVVATRTDGGTDSRIGEIVVLNGSDGTELFRIPEDPPNNQFGAHGLGTPAVGDVDGDMLPDIIYFGRPDASDESVVYAVNGQGQLLASSFDGAGEVRMEAVHAAVSVANFDADAQAEVVIGATLMDDDLRVVWNSGGAGALQGSNGTYRGGVSAIADLNADTVPEIISGNDAWSVTWVSPLNVTVNPFWSHSGPDGYPAVADIDQDGDPEVILVAAGTVRVLNGQTGELWCGIDPTDAMCAAMPALRTQPIDIPGGAGRGGPPTVADFDGDGRPEMATAGRSDYLVIDAFRPMETIVQPMGDPPPALGDIFIRWRVPTLDQSSQATGSSVFDFQGDGAAEVLYGDECFTRVYDGSDGSILVEIPNASRTVHEYPLVVDVDRDNNAEVLVVANGSGPGAVPGSCEMNFPGYNMGPGVRNGVYAYGDMNDMWVPTRNLWTSHTYHVTNAASDGNVPVTETDNWTVPGLNNYRQNVQGEGVFNAPDLTLDLTTNLNACADMQLVLNATVRNIGSIGVGPGVEVTLFEGTDVSGILIGTLPTTEPLLPGGSTTVQWVLPLVNPNATDYFAVVDGVDAMAGTVTECDETNNTALVTSAACPTPG